MEHISVRGAPNQYECRVGVLNELEERLRPLSVKTGLVIHGEKSWRATKPYFPKMESLSLTFIQYAGECSENEISRITEEANKREADVIIGIGGGKVVDLAKAVGNRIARDVVLIPTLASTCAAWTPLSVIYDDAGRFVTYTVYPRSAYMVLIEPRIMLQAPIEYLRAGIGDTLAKWYEAEALTRTLEEPSVPVQIALQTAKLCKDVLLKDGATSLQDVRDGKLSPSVLRVIEANIAAGGMVGGFGDQYGRIAGAHSVHNSLTRLNETHYLLHGEKVAYGLLVQLALENNWEEIERLVPHYGRLRLPCSLSDLGLSIENRTAIETIAEGTLLPGESIHFMPSRFVPADVIRAIDALETYSTVTT